MAKLNAAGRAAAAAKTAANRAANKTKSATAKQIKQATNEGKAVGKAMRSGSIMTKKIATKPGASGRGFTAGKVRASTFDSVTSSDNLAKTKQEASAYRAGKASVSGVARALSPRGARKPNANRTRANAAKSRGQGWV